MTLICKREQHQVRLPSCWIPLAACSLSVFSPSLISRHSLSCNQIKTFRSCERHRITIIWWRSQDRNHSDHIRAQLERFIPKPVIHHLDKRDESPHKMTDGSKLSEITFRFWRERAESREPGAVSRSKPDCFVPVRYRGQQQNPAEVHDHGHLPLHRHPPPRHRFRFPEWREHAWRDR